MRDYSKIDACNLADDLAVEIYQLTRSFPKEGLLTAVAADNAAGQSRRTYACLYGLIRAVEKEAGFLSKLAAASTSFIAIWLTRLACRPFPS